MKSSAQCTSVHIYRAVQFTAILNFMCLCFSCVRFEHTREKRGRQRGKEGERERDTERERRKEVGNKRGRGNQSKQAVLECANGWLLLSEKATSTGGCPDVTGIDPEYIMLSSGLGGSLTVAA